MRPLPLSLAIATVFCSLSVLPATAFAGDVYAVTDDARLVRFDDATPGVLDADVAITGLTATESVIALDLHPCDDRLFALTDEDRIYTIDPETGEASTSSALSNAIGTDVVGAAFDPQSLALRVVDASDGNRTIDVDSGAVTTETDLHFDVLGPDNGRDPFVSAIAFANGVLLGIDAELDELVSIDPATDGTIVRIGRLGLDAAAPVGLDYRSGDERLFASINVGGLSGLYGVDPSNGHIRFFGTIGDGTPVIDIAAAPIPFASLQMEKLDLKFNFNQSGKDQLHLRGRIAAPDGDYAGMTATVDVGGEVRTFMLESNGKGTSGAATFHLEGAPKDGLVKYDVKFKKGDFSDAFADEGMDGSEAAKKAERRIVVVIELDAVSYASEAIVSYTAKVGKSGNAKLTATSSIGTLPDGDCPPPLPPPAPFEVIVKGNKNTVTLVIGEAGESPFQVNDNNSAVTVRVPADMAILVVVNGNKNDVVIPAELSDDTTVSDNGNNNSVARPE